MWIEPLCACVLYPMGSLEFYDHIWALRRHLGHMTYMLDSDWWKKILLRSDWLIPKGAICTTPPEHFVFSDCCFYSISTLFC